MRKSHGGKRANQTGRPVTVHAVTVSMSLDPATVTRISSRATEWQCSKSEVVRRAVKFI